MRLSLVAFALGVLLLQQQAVLPFWAVWGGGLGGLVCCAGVLLRDSPQGLSRHFFWLLMLAAAGFAGFGYGAWRAEARLAQSLPAALEGVDLRLTGYVATLPQQMGDGLGSRFVFAVEQAPPGVPERLLLSWYAPRRAAAEPAAQPPALSPGQRWQLVARLKQAHGQVNPTGFDYEGWLFERGLRATGSVRPLPASRLPEDAAGLQIFIEGQRQRLRTAFEALLPAADYPYAGVLVALAIGDQNAIDKDLWPLFNRTGITHLVAISGMHVTLLASLAGWLTSALWRRLPWLANRFAAQRAAVLVGLLVALGYSLLAGFAVPAQRTLIMLAVAALALSIHRHPAPSRVLALALAGVLLIDPWAVNAAGFWLSFGAVAGLLLVALSLQAAPLPNRKMAPRRHFLKQWGMTQWAATLATLPILLLIFGQFSLVSPLANAMAIPLVSLVVTPLVLLATLWPAGPPLMLAHAVFSGLMMVLLPLSGWPVWQAGVPHLAAVLAALVGVIVLLLPRGVPGKGAGVVLLLPVLFWPAERPAHGEARLTVLDVGQGLAVLVETQAHALLYDTGPRYGPDADAGQRVVLPHLRGQGIDRLDAVIVTHRDTDHAGGAASVDAVLPVARWLSSVDGMQGERCRAGERWAWDGVEFALLHPAPEDYQRGGKANHVSCVLRVTAFGKAALLTADIETPDETALRLRDAGALAAEVLLVPHHGSKTSSSPAFLDAVGSRHAIIPVGYRNAFGHPKAEVLDRLAQRGTRIWRTDRDGALTIRLNQNGAEVRSAREQRRRYWMAR